MNERLNGVGVFVAVVEAGSFAVAAQRLAVTRSAVAKTIARLEQRLKVRLFNRTTRKQSLTENGHAYYERCVRALAELEAAEECLESGRKRARRQSCGDGAGIVWAALCRAHSAGPERAPPASCSSK